MNACIETARLILRPFRVSDHRQNIFFHRDADGKPIWKDTYIYARLREED